MRERENLLLVEQDGEDDEEEKAKLKKKKKKGKKPGDADDEDDDEAKSGARPRAAKAASLGEELAEEEEDEFGDDAEARAAERKHVKRMARRAKLRKEGTSKKPQKRCVRTFYTVFCLNRYDLHVTRKHWHWNATFSLSLSLSCSTRLVIKITIISPSEPCFDPYSGSLQIQGCGAGGSRAGGKGQRHGRGHAGV